MIKYHITEAAPSIYHLQFDDQYEMAMLFCRFQETYESPNDNFRNKAFTLFDFMSWYAKDRDGVFTYPKDWAGFNCPSYILKNIFDRGIPDYNQYDAEMNSIHNKLTDLSFEEHYTSNYYLIASCSTDNETLAHEIGHGRYYLEKDYRKEMLALVEKLPSKTYEKLCQWLSEIGYTKEVFDDEIQAYLSTSPAADLKERMKGKIADWRKTCQPFRAVYQQYNKDLSSLAKYWKEQNDR